MRLIERLIEKAQSHPMRVALPECEADKTLLAARQALDKGIAFPVLVNDPAVIVETARRCGVSTEGMEIVNTADGAAKRALAEAYMTYPRRRYDLNETLCQMSDPVAYAMVLTAAGRAETVFCGHVSTTKKVLFTARHLIGMMDGVDAASIVALAEIPGYNGPEGEVLALADCALNVDPGPEALSGIAIAACETAGGLMGWQSRCAFLSFSTCGSGAGASVEKIHRALEIARQRRPDLLIDGEFQLDAALIPAVAAKKVGGDSPVAGRANVLIFPNLDAANMGVKMIQIFAGGSVYGHTLSGIALPVADSSRGASVEEIVGDIAMLVIAAGER